jgi:hypothetical protein
MKRAIQIFAALLIALLTGGPAWAAVDCALGNSAMGASCPMGMAQMDADCPMSHALAMMDCSQDCCNRTIPQAVGVLVFPSKPRLLIAALQVQSLVALPSSGIKASASPVPLVLAPPLSRHVLFRVFRI